MKKYLLLFSILIIVSCASYDSENDYKNAEAILDKDPVKAYSLLNHAAEHGNTEAMALLGVELLNACEGEGFNQPKSDRCWKIKRDPKKALSYLLKAAANGSSYANEWLVSIYTSGYPGVDEPKNETAAFYWANRNTNNAHGLHTLANMYNRGIGTEVNIVAAEKYYLESIENGNGEEAEYWVASSAASLAEIYAKGGSGFEIDCIKSGYYLSKVVTKCSSYYVSWYEREIKVLETNTGCKKHFQNIEKLCPKS